MQNRIVRIALITAGILAIPLVAMQFSSDMNWGPFDFLTIGVLLFSAGLSYELLTHTCKNRRYRVAIGIAIILCVLYVWAELAVGIFTNWGS